MTAIDPQKKSVALQNGASIGYDKLVLSPGVDMMFDSIEGLQAANASGQILQAWKAGAETLALRKQLEAMPDGGVYALTVSTRILFGYLRAASSTLPVSALGSESPSGLQAILPGYACMSS